RRSSVLNTVTLRARLGGDDVHELVGNHNDLHDLLPLQELLNFSIRQGALLAHLLGCAEGDANAAAEFPVHLNWQLSFFFLGQFGIEARPGLPEYWSRPAEFFPHFLRQVRSKRTEQ